MALDSFALPANDGLRRIGKGLVVEPALHPAEAERLAALRRYGILDTPREKDFDDIVNVVSAICDTPISVITLVDRGRQWFKAEVGLGISETPLPVSICAHAILQRGLFIVPDTLNDTRFADNPLVAGDPHLRFYAGALLETSEGLPLGTLCVLDYKPRALNANQQELLRVMADQIMRLLETRRLAAAEHAARTKAELLLRENETLARESDHRVMNSLQLVSAVLGLQSRTASEEAKIGLQDAQRRVQAIATVHRQLHLTGSMADIEIGEFLRRLCENLKANAPPEVTGITVNADERRLPSEIASAIGLLVAELVANCFKHAFPKGRTGAIAVAFSATQENWTLSVIDNGAGLPSGFDPETGKGVGLRVINSLVRRLEAVMTAGSRGGETSFVVTTAKN